MQINFISSSFIQTLTVGPGVAPSQPLFDIAAGRGLYRQWGITPRPEESPYLFFLIITLLFSVYKKFLQTHAKSDSLFLKIQ